MVRKKIKTDTALYIDGHRKWYVVGFLVALAAFSWAAIVAHKHSAAGWEVQLFRDINNWPDGWRTFFLTISLVGGSVWAAAGAVAITFFAKAYRLCWRMAASIVGAYGVAFIAKHFIGRVRPAGLLENIHVRAVETGMGFPSGHATISTVIMLTLLPYMPKKWRWIIPVVIGVVCVSRLYLGVHFPLDVLGGMCVGTIVVSFIRIMPQPLRVFLRLD